MEYVLWGTKKGAKPWEEDIISKRNKLEDLEPARLWAEKNGFINLRVAAYEDNEQPDFTTILKGGK